MRRMVRKSGKVKDKRESSDFKFLSSFLDGVGDEATAEISAGLRGEETITDTAGDSPGGQTA